MEQKFYRDDNPVNATLKLNTSNMATMLASSGLARHGDKSMRAALRLGVAS
ncbi:hypothetical protein Z947_317 [Sulfitobacter geojensis]|nr:hypothetical protein Z947_317 [Sulfitobacter geojensis]